PPGLSSNQTSRGSGGRTSDPIFSDPRIQQIYTTALSQFATAERLKANTQVNQLEAKKRQLNQQLKDQLAAMNAEQRQKIYAALDKVGNQGRGWVDSKANGIKGAIQGAADKILGLIDGAIRSQVYSIPGI